MSCSRVAEEVSRLKRGIALQEATDAGAVSQWKADSASVVGVLHFAVHGKSVYRGDLIGGPLDACEVRNGRRLEIEYFRQIGMYRKVTASEAREAGPNILGVRWVDIRKAEGTHRSRLVAKEIKEYNTLESLVAAPPSSH